MIVEGWGGRRRRVGARTRGGERGVERLVGVGEGGSGRVEGGEAGVGRAHRAVGREAELRGARAPLGCVLMVMGEEVNRGRAWGDYECGR